jgi:aspartate racemase
MQEQVMTPRESRKGTERRLGGILGGMGPMATAEFLRRVVLNTSAREEQEHLPLVIYNNPQIPDRTAAILARGKSPLPALRASARLLEKSGATFIAIPCVTAHCFFDQLQDQIDIEILHLVREMVSEVAHAHPGVHRVGLLATTGTISTGLMQTHFTGAGYEVLTPKDIVQQACVMGAIYGARGLKVVGPNSDARRALRSAAAHLIRRGAEIVLLGCTEIPLVLSGARLRVPLVDSLDVLARAVVREAFGKNSLWQAPAGSAL